jgi:hypothetical protein
MLVAADEDFGLLIYFSKSTRVWLCILAARCVRALHLFALLLLRGRREDRVLAAPEVSCAVAHSKKRTRAYRYSGASRPSLRSGFTAYFVLFPENGSFASVACASYRTLNASTAAPEPHDFAVRSRLRQEASPGLVPVRRSFSEGGSRAYVERAFSVHRISPHVSDDGQRPSSAARRAELCD